MRTSRGDLGQILLQGSGIMATQQIVAVVA
jgi:hypothetical protein